MVPRVVGGLVPGHPPVEHVGVLAHPPADHEERGRYAEPVQRVEHGVGPLRTRAVVERQRHQRLVGVDRPGDEQLPAAGVGLARSHGRPGRPATDRQVAVGNAGRLRERHRAHAGAGREQGGPAQHRPAVGHDALPYESSVGGRVRGARGSRSTSNWSVPSISAPDGAGRTGTGVSGSSSTGGATPLPAPPPTGCRTRGLRREPAEPRAQPLLRRLDHRVERRHQHQRQQRRADQAADHHDGQRLRDEAALAGEPERHRQQREDRRDRGHQDRPQPVPAALDHRLPHAHALRAGTG